MSESLKKIIEGLNQQIEAPKEDLGKMSREGVGQSILNINKSKQQTLFPPYSTTRNRRLKKEEQSKDTDPNT